MCEFVIYYRNKEPKAYSVRFDPWPTWGMLRAIAKEMLRDKGGYSVSFTGPNGLQGLIKRD